MEETDETFVNRTAQYSLNWALTEVKVYTEYLHIANVAWQAEQATLPDGSKVTWYSGWFEPHNSPRRWYRAEELDCPSLFGVGGWVIKLMAREYNQAQLKEYGIVGEYEPRRQTISA